jgi:hypothetical protein
VYTTDWMSSDRRFSGVTQDGVASLVSAGDALPPSNVNTASGILTSALSQVGR